MNTVLVVAAHPDDEVLGAGGALARHQAEGDAITILLLSNGEDSRGSALADAGKRKQQAETAAGMLGARVFFDDLPDNAFDSVPLLDIARKVESVIRDVQPAVIYTHFSNDLNIDHRLTAQAVLTAARPQPGFPVRQILSFEVRSSTEWQDKNMPEQFTPGYYTDISEYIERKKELLSVYADEMREYPHPRSLDGVQALAAYRGTEVGMRFAEAFQVVRILR